MSRPEAIAAVLRRMPELAEAFARIEAERHASAQETADAVHTLACPKSKRQQVLPW